MREELRKGIKEFKDATLDELRGVSKVVSIFTKDLDSRIAVLYHSDEFRDQKNRVVGQIAEIENFKRNVADFAKEINKLFDAEIEKMVKYIEESEKEE